MITGKNKEEFEKWYINDYVRRVENRAKNVWMTKMFYKSTFEMQSGILTAYYDSVGLTITLDHTRVSDNLDFLWTYTMYFEKDLWQPECDTTRPEALKEAFKRANQIINEKLKG